MFKPAWWLPGSHLQTVWQPLFRRSPPLHVRRERIDTPDGDFLDLDWYAEEYQPLVILLHGLTGSSRSPYIVGMQYALSLHGYRSVAMNFRGCGGEPNRTWKAYHSGETSDLRHLIARLQSIEPGTVLNAVGFSLGGNVLLKYLGEAGHDSGIGAAVSVSAPIRLADCATRLDSGLSRLYRNQLIKELKQYITVKKQSLRDMGLVNDAARLANLGNLDAVRSFWEYDDRVVAPLYGFKDVQDYYSQSSSIGYLRFIQTPTLIIQSLDDPFLTRGVVPLPGECGVSVTVKTTKSGGHVGFIEGNVPWCPSYWVETEVSGFFKRQYSL